MAFHLFIKIFISIIFISVEARPRYPYPGYEISFAQVPKRSPTMTDNEIGFDDDDLALDAADCKNLNLPPEADDCVPGMEDMPQYQRSSKDNIVVMFDDAVMLALPDCDQSKVPFKCPPKPTRGPLMGLVVPEKPDPHPFNDDAGEESPGGSSLDEDNND